MAHSRVLSSYKRALEIVESAMLGQEGHHATAAPFMQPLPARKGLLCHLDRQVDLFLNDLSLTPLLRCIYRVVGTARCELLYGGWTLMMLQEVHRRWENYVSQGQARAVDFAVRSLGMGHCMVASYDPLYRKVYYRHDGGSNGYDREAHHHFAVGFQLLPTQGYDVDHWASPGATFEMVN